MTMLAWLTENLATLLVLAVLAAALVGIFLHLLRRKRSGKGACGCNCGACPMHGACHKE